MLPSAAHVLNKVSPFPRGYRAGTPNVPPVTGWDTAAGPDLAADAGPPLKDVIATAASTISDDPITISSEWDLIAAFLLKNDCASLKWFS
jgi:hypothetical protein